jgi:hypothetical protein
MFIVILKLFTFLLIFIMVRIFLIYKQSDVSGNTSDGINALTFVTVFQMGSDPFRFLSIFCRKIQTRYLIPKHMVSEDKPGDDNMQLQTQRASKVRSVVEDIQIMQCNFTRMRVILE